MFQTIIEDLTNTFKALMSLLFRPKTCFKQEKDGYLTCSNISGMRFWLYLLLFEAAMFLITSKALSEHFLQWFMLITVMSSIVRILIVVGIWAIISKLFFGEVRPIISICFFVIGAVSLFMYIPIIPAIYDIGLSTFLSGNFPEGFAEKYKYNFLLLALTGFVSYIFALIYIGNHYKNYLKAGLFLLIVVVLYTLIRPFIIVPLMELAVNFVLTTPWNNT